MAKFSQQPSELGVNFVEFLIEPRYLAVNVIFRHRHFGPVPPLRGGPRAPPQVLGIDLDLFRLGTKYAAANRLLFPVD